MVLSQQGHAMSEIKPIFVDIDGVVNSSRSVHVKIGPDEHSKIVEDLADFAGPLPYGVVHALKTVDPVCVALVNKLFDDIHASGKIGVFVLSSTHRKHFHNGKYGNADHLVKLRKYLTAMGFNVPTMFSITQSLHVPRGEEVKMWLASEDCSEADYVILDDGADFDTTQPLVRVDPTIGMSFENYADACKYLSLPSPGLILL